MHPPKSAPDEQVELGQYVCPKAHEMFWLAMMQLPGVRQPCWIVRIWNRFRTWRIKEHMLYCSYCPVWYKESRRFLNLYQAASAPDEDVEAEGLTPLRELEPTGT